MKLKLVRLSLIMCAIMVAQIVLMGAVSAKGHQTNCMTGERQAIVNGEKISYTINKSSNKKGTIIFLHGALFNQETMKPLAEKFNDYQTVTVDLPGHGKSTGEAKGNVEEYADVITDFINQLTKKREISNNIILVGWSMGGSVSLEVALKNVPQVKKIVLVDSAPKWNIQPMPEGMTIKDLVAMSFTSSTPEESKERILNEVDSYIAIPFTCYMDTVAANKYDSTERIKNIKIPVLIIGGDKDMLAPIDMSYVMNENIPNSKLTVMEDRGHNLVMESPEVVAKEIKNFLKGK